MVDITLEAGDGYFCYTVRAIIINENRVLMVKNDNYPYYYCVGGRVKFGETTEEAALREVREETGIEFEIDRLAFIYENFFEADFLDNKPFHEVSLFFLMKANADIENIYCNSVGADGGKESLHWLPIEELSSYHMFPEFFKTELKALKNEVGRFVTKNGNTYRLA